MKGRRILLWSGAVLLGLASLGAACGDETTRIEGGDNQEHGITVSGEGRVTGTPDVAIVSLGVSARADSVAAARDQAATTLDAIIATMKDNGINEKDIQTQYLSIQPELDYRDGNPIIRGYNVSNTVRASIRDIDTTSKVIDDAVRAGGDNTRVDNISFTIDDPKALQEEARQKAVEDARAKAQTLADAGGVELGDAINISETGGNEPPGPVLAERSAAAADVATPIQPGELDVVIDVSVTWQIK